MPSPRPSSWRATCRRTRSSCATCRGAATRTCTPLPRARGWRCEPRGFLPRTGSDGRGRGKEQMNRIDSRFARLRAANRKALIPFVTAGDPSLESLVPVMHALVQAGADVIELGVPFSDPMADGPTIQRSSERALARGAGLSFVFDGVRRFRQRDAATPVVLMGYLNPVEVRGADRFAREAADAGVDGVLLVDLPPEEAGGFRDAFAAHGVALVLLASPTTTPARLETLCAQVQGYLYYVSLAGVTGASEQLDTAAA